LNNASLKVLAIEGIILGRNISGAIKIPRTRKINKAIVGLCEMSHKGASSLIFSNTGLTKFIYPAILVVSEKIKYIIRNSN